MKKIIVFVLFVIFIVLCIKVVAYKINIINSAYRDIQLERLINTVEKDFKIRDESGKIELSKNEIWVGVVVEENGGYDKVKEKIIRLYGENSGIMCKPYSGIYADSCHFTGIQKEVISVNGTDNRELTENLYFIYRTYKPILWDKQKN